MSEQIGNETIAGKFNTVLQAARTFGMRDGVLRLQYEMKRSSGLLFRQMRSVGGWNSWEMNRIAPVSSPGEMLAARRSGTRPFFFADVPALADSLRHAMGPDGEDAVIAGAERILAGHLPFFGSLDYDCGFPPRWFQNPVTGQSVSASQPWPKMRFVSSSYGDLKFILEPSRFLFVYPLVRAYALTGDERFPQAFWSSLEDWAIHSPPMEGPLWICGQECSLRILAWSFALHAFIRSPSTTPERLGALVSMIAAHAWRTVQTLDYALSQRSNHLVTEAVGLWTAGTLYPELAEARGWQALGADLLRGAVLDQITTEGAPRQHSFNYHRMILHLLLWTIRLSEICQAPIHPDIRDRAQCALRFMRSWVDSASGCVPNYGSDDGSLILPLASASYRDFRPLLQLGAAVLDGTPLPSGPWNEAPLWFGVEPCAHALAKANGLRTGDCKSEFDKSGGAKSGYFRLGDAASWAMIRAGQYTRRPFQSDQLHVDLWWRGVNLARDAGTYLYNGPPPWNNSFAGTAIHNTVTVDHQDQMRRGGRFLWLDWAQASGSLDASREASCPDRFAGEHDGYRRLRVIHRRAVQWLPECGWVIVDDLTGSGEHDLCLHWLTADFPFERSASPFQLTMNAASSRVHWTILSSTPGRSGVFRAGRSVWPDPEESPAHPASHLLGWEASTYGDLRPAISMIHQARSRLPFRFVTVLLAGERCRMEMQGREIVIFSGQGTVDRHGGAEETEIHRLSLAPGSLQLSQRTQAAKSRPTA